MKLERCGHWNRCFVVSRRNIPPFPRERAGVRGNRPHSLSANVRCQIHAGPRDSVLECVQSSAAFAVNQPITRTTVQ